MRVLIMTDLEGVSGVNHIDMMKGERYGQARKLLTEDTNAALSASLKRPPARITALKEK